MQYILIRYSCSQRHVKQVIRAEMFCEKFPWKYLEKHLFGNIWQKFHWKYFVKILLEILIKIFILHFTPFSYININEMLCQPSQQVHHNCCCLVGLFITRLQYAQCLLPPIVQVECPATTRVLGMPSGGLQELPHSGACNNIALSHMD